MLRRLAIQNYRSLRRVQIELGPLTVITGPNGSGKSNLYEALGLIQAAATGRFKQAILDHGGMPSVLWAGRRGKGPVRMRLAADIDDLSYELVAGLAPKDAPQTRFVLDPQVKEESLHIGEAGTPEIRLMDRGVGAATLTTSGGDRELVKHVDVGESVLSQIGDPSRFPELTDLGRRVKGWRFYHHFDTGPHSVIRRVQPGVRTSVLASDGHDLAAAIATLEERGDAAPLHGACPDAFPGCSVFVDGPSNGNFVVKFDVPGLGRPLTAAELSDGQVRFLCLAMALLTTRPPELLVLNEPETSLHPAAVRALAPLILQAARFGQVWVATHDRSLGRLLAPEATTIELSLSNGETIAVSPD